MASNIPSGYDLDWVEDPPDDLKCLICLCVARDPQQHLGDDTNECGKIFCNDCISKYLTKKTTCPNCQQKIRTKDRLTKSNLFKDSKSARQIRSLKVKCDNETIGCDWIGELGSVETHLQSCDYALLPCTNKCKIQNVIAEFFQKDLSYHLANDCPRRQYECPHCQETGEHQERTTTHLDTCPKVRVKCDNETIGCDWTGEISSHEIHLQSCDYALLPCVNHCKIQNVITEFFRKDLPHHLANDCPRRQYECPHCQETGEHQERTTTHLDTCPRVKTKCPNTDCQDIIARCDIGTHQSSCKYEILTCKYSCFGCKEKPLRKNLQTHENDDRAHFRVTREKVYELSQRVALLEEKAMANVKLEDGTTVHAEWVKSLTTVTRTLRLTDYQEHKISCNKQFYTPPFYTSSKGYKMCLEVYASGRATGTSTGAGTHVSVYAYLMKGDHDDTLTWPFTGRVTVELLNQLEDNNHYTETITFPEDSVASRRVLDRERGLGWGFQNFISHTALIYNVTANTQYLKDDTLVFKFSVKVPHFVVHSH